MAREVECKGCKVKVPEFEILKGYCHICSAAIVEKHGETVELLERIEVASNKPVKS
jgi:hypothetical protein